MRIEIDLTQEEAIKIIIAYLQPMFPGKFITGKLKSYGDSQFTVVDAEEKPEEIITKE